MASTISDQPVEDGNSSNSRRQRVRQRAACANCRRKKVRCTGERPTCALCARTCQANECLYDTPPDYGHGDNRDSEILVLLHDLSQRMSNMENAISRLSNSQVACDGRCSEARTSKRRKITTPSASSSNHPSPSVLNSPLTAIAEDYHRILPLPTQRLLCEAADVYIRYCHNQPYCVFNIQALQLHPERLPLYLQFTLVATAARFSNLWMSDNECVERGLQSITRYASAAWRNISMPWSCHDDSVIFPSIQAIHLLSVIDYTSGRTSTAWLKLGMALRLAHLMKLHVEITEPTLLADAHQEERRRMYWSLFILDRLISCSKERSPAITEEECHSFIPCTEREWETGEFHHERFSLDDVLNNPIRPNLIQNHFALMILSTAILGRVCRYVLRDDKTSTQSVPWASNSQHSRLDAALLDLENCYIEDGSQDMVSAATQIQEGVKHIHHSKLVFHLCYCLLCHPFLLHKRLVKLNKTAPPSFVQRIVSVSQAHAVAITECATRLRKQDTVMPSFYAYCQAVAWTIHALANSSGVPSLHALDPQSAYEGEGLENLQYIATHWPHAAYMVTNIENARQSLKDMGVFSITRGSNAPDEEHARRMWDVVDYGAISRDAPPEDSSGPLESTDMLQITDGLDPVFMELLSRQPEIGTDIWQSLDSMPIGV